MIQLDFNQPILQNIQKLEDFQEDWILDIKNFLVLWNSNSNHIELKSSGTTGNQKTFLAEKKWMIESANNTLSYFNLSKGNSALLALSVHFIAGKMMVVRAIQGQLKLYLVPPNDLSILDSNIQIDFCPLVPIQAKKHFNNLNKIKHLLIGGAPLTTTLELQLKTLKTQVYHSFAMTETLSHFALKNISSGDSYYKVFETIEFGINNSSCLWIKAPLLGQNFIQTNDIVELTKFGFIWKGREDFVINSGGIKFNPQEIEKKCTPLNFENNLFIISALPDETLGEKIVLVIENKKQDLVQLKLEKKDFDLENYAIPKEVYLIKKLPKTAHSNKIQRLKKEVIFHPSNIIHHYKIR